MKKVFFWIKKCIPKKFLDKIRPIYNLLSVILAAVFYGFPSKKIKIIGVTGTKGKSTTTEIISAIFEEAGYSTAVSNTIRFKIGNKSNRNMIKMSMPGGFFLQKFLAKAVREKIDFAIIEMTSEGSKFKRHRFLNLERLVFTNLSQEHLEAHGGYENYLQAKLDIGRHCIEKSSRKDTAVIVNSDDKESCKFIELKAVKKYKFSLSDVDGHEIKKDGISFQYGGQKIISPLLGLFNLYNILAAISVAESYGIKKEIIKKAVEKFSGVRGRVEKIILDENDPDFSKQDFAVVVDYAHTEDSLEKIFKVFFNSEKIAVMGGTGGGRDKQKRKKMGAIAGKYCSKIILTTEDPYDEDPMEIIKDVAAGISSPIWEIVIDRREAISRAIELAKTGDTVLILSKGNNPYIMRKNGIKELWGDGWGDARVAKEELKKVLAKK